MIVMDGKKMLNMLRHNKSFQFNKSKCWNVMTTCLLKEDCTIEPSILYTVMFLRNQTPIEQKFSFQLVKQ
ncbi:hypothetical protein CEXT_164211 [Caerostris extrusa]|uniref:Uncharacterized protein n=1 Tax=Caerostris extrusa TaxID=172846 RepID=A0AAV4XP76_CAEEX|nr:hypothetical protein CEXT_164211 [Caerostris extrusa]